MTMKIDIDYVARLARLRLNDTERELFASQLENILEYIHQLNELDTGETEPTAHVLSLTNVMRQDVSRPSLEKDLALDNAPESRDGFFVVPQIID